MATPVFTAGPRPSVTVPLSQFTTARCVASVCELLPRDQVERESIALRAAGILEGAYSRNYSPDRLRLATSLGRQGDAGLATINSDGSGLRILTTIYPNERNQAAVWSPDGSMLAFIAWTNCGGMGCPSTLRIVAADGSSTWDVSPPNAEFSRSPRWSADGTGLMFVSDGVLYISPARGGGAKSIHTDNLVLREGAWLADGRLLLWGRTPSGSQGPYLYIAAADGSGARLLTSRRAYVVSDGLDQFRLSPDRRCVAYLSDDDNRSSTVFVTCIDGTDLQITDRGKALDYQWLVDGRLAAGSREGCIGTLVVTLPSGSRDCIP